MDEWLEYDVGLILGWMFRLNAALILGLILGCMDERKNCSQV